MDPNHRPDQTPELAYQIQQVVQAAMTAASNAASNAAAQATAQANSVASSVERSALADEVSRAFATATSSGADGQPFTLRLGPLRVELSREPGQNEQGEAEARNVESNAEKDAGRDAERDASRGPESYPGPPGFPFNSLLSGLFRGPPPGPPPGPPGPRYEHHGPPGPPPPGPPGLHEHHPHGFGGFGRFAGPRGPGFEPRGAHGHPGPRGHTEHHHGPPGPSHPPSPPAPHGHHEHHGKHGKHGLHGLNHGHAGYPGPHGPHEHNHEHRHEHHPPPPRYFETTSNTSVSTLDEENGVSGRRQVMLESGELTVDFDYEVRPNTRRVDSPVDVFCNERDFTILLSLPGVNTDDIELKVCEDTQVVSIRGSAMAGGGAGVSSDNLVVSSGTARLTGKFSVVVKLPGKLDLENIKAKSKYGLLKVVVPYAESLRGKVKAVPIERDTEDNSGDIAMSNKVPEKVSQSSSNVSDNENSHQSEVAPQLDYDMTAEETLENDADEDPATPDIESLDNDTVLVD